MKKFNILILATCLVSCGRRNDDPVNVEYILPDSYQGVFKLIEDRHVGLEIDPKGGELKIAVPKSGVVRLKDLGILGKWHKPQG